MLTRTLSTIALASGAVSIGAVVEGVTRINCKVSAAEEAHPLPPQEDIDFSNRIQAENSLHNDLPGRIVQNAQNVAEKVRQRETAIADAQRGTDTDKLEIGLFAGGGSTGSMAGIGWVFSSIAKDEAAKILEKGIEKHADHAGWDTKKRDEVLIDLKLKKAPSKLKAKAQNLFTRLREWNAVGNASTGR